MEQLKTCVVETSVGRGLERCVGAGLAGMAGVLMVSCALTVTDARDAHSRPSYAGMTRTAYTNHNLPPLQPPLFTLHLCVSLLYSYNTTETKPSNVY